jgi:hypothetical protein
MSATTTERVRAVSSTDPGCEFTASGRYRRASGYERTPVPYHEPAGISRHRSDRELVATLLTTRTRSVVAPF